MCQRVSLLGSGDVLHKRILKIRIRNEEFRVASSHSGYFYGN